MRPPRRTGGALAGIDGRTPTTGADAAPTTMTTHPPRLIATESGGSSVGTSWSPRSHGTARTASGHRRGPPPAAELRPLGEARGADAKQASSDQGSERLVGHLHTALSASRHPTLQSRSGPSVPESARQPSRWSAPLRPARDIGGIRGALSLPRFTVTSTAQGVCMHLHALASWLGARAPR